MPTRDSRPTPLPCPSENRTLPRVGADFPVDLWAAGFSGPLPGRARDIGTGGVCVATPSVFDFKGIHRVTLKLPDSTLDLNAAGTWQCEAPSDQLIFTGVSFVDPSPEDLDYLLDVVIDGGKRLARFLCGRSDLRGLGIDAAMGLAQVTRLREVAAGATLYRQDSRNPGQDSIFIIGRGQVALQVRVRGAREIVFEKIGPGSICGGLSIVAEVEPGESAVADESTQLYEIDRNAFHYLYRTKPWLAQQLAFAVTQAAARRMREVLARTRDAL